VVWLLPLAAVLEPTLQGLLLSLVGWGELVVPMVVKTQVMELLVISQEPIF
jgi:hypothetical protein